MPGPQASLPPTRFIFRSSLHIPLLRPLFSSYFCSSCPLRSSLPSVPAPPPSFLYSLHPSPSSPLLYSHFSPSLPPLHSTPLPVNPGLLFTLFPFKPLRCAHASSVFCSSHHHHHLRAPLRPPAHTSDSFPLWIYLGRESPQTFQGIAEA